MLDPMGTDWPEGGRELYDMVSGLSALRAKTPALLQGNLKRLYIKNQEVNVLVMLKDSHVQIWRCAFFHCSECCMYNYGKIFHISVFICKLFEKEQPHFNVYGGLQL